MFMYYSGGIIKGSQIACQGSDPYTGKPLFNHGVTIVGYETTSTDPYCSGFWVIKNQWGDSWGENGFARLCIPSNEASLPSGTCNINYFDEPLWSPYMFYLCLCIFF
jgi:hypothetical protein